MRFLSRAPLGALMLVVALTFVPLGSSRSEAQARRDPGSSSSLVFVRRGRLVTLDLRRGTTSRMTDRPLRAHGPAWAPNVKKIAFSCRPDGGDSDICIVNVASKMVETITTDGGAEDEPTWAPGGGSLYFVRSMGMGLGESLIRLRLSTGDEEVVTTQTTISAPDVSPDGTKVAFGSLPVGKSSEDLFIMNVDGTSLEQITDNDVPDRNPAWSPDASQIAFDRFKEGSSAVASKYVLRLYSVDDGKVAKVKRGIGIHPSWAPGGRRIAFYRLVDGTQFDLFTVRRSGGNRTRLTATKADELEPDWSL